MVEMNRRERERLRHRQEIMAVAERLFAENGFHLTTMEAIAKAAEWSKGALYLHFKNKEELFFSILTDKLDKLFATIRESLERAEDLETAVEQYISLNFNFFQENREMFQLFLTEQGRSLRASAEGPHHEQMMSRQLEFQAYLIHRIQTLLPDTTHVSARSLVLSLIGAIIQHFLYWLITEEELDLRTARAEIVELLISGVEHAQI